MALFPEESTSGIAIGRELAAEMVTGAPEDKRIFQGEIYAVSMKSSAAFSVSDAHCLPSETASDLVLDLKGSEVATASKMNNFANDAKNTWFAQYGDASVTSPGMPFTQFTNSTCGTYGADATESTLDGTALHEGVAGQCMSFSITAVDMCGSKLKEGGSGFKVEVVGPLHLHTQVLTLTPGSGIEDVGDGSYLVKFTRDLSGYYKINVLLDGTAMAQYNVKTYVHPYVTDAATTFLYDGPDEGHLSKALLQTHAGVPAAFQLQTVDQYGNLRTQGGETNFAMRLEGPKDVPGSYSDDTDGSYTFRYTPAVPGHYRMYMGHGGSPVFSYGGYTCVGGTKTGRDYCTLGLTSSDGVEKPFCVAVSEDSSLSTFAGSTYATFPDSDALDLAGPFTIGAWVKKGADTGSHREYVVQKQSQYSGKGWWMALVPTSVSGQYELEVGAYVGAEVFRVTKETTPIVAGAWTHLLATYDGVKMVLYVDGTVLETSSYSGEPLFQKRSSQPVKVGSGFGGEIDNVYIFSEVRTPAHFTGDTMCPIGVSTAESNLVAYYRMNEGYGFGLTDEALNNDGVVGLVCDMAPEGKNVRLTCPSGYNMSAVLYANFGDNDGTCGKYSHGGCSSDISSDVVSSLCLGKESCVVPASTKLFGNPCKHEAKSLAVNAVCSSATKPSHFAKANAPSSVGVAVPTAPKCPWDMLNELPPSLKAKLSALPKDCDLTTAQVGVTKYALFDTRDACGFEDNNYVTCVNYDAESLEILGKGCSAVKAELDANPAAYAGVMEVVNVLCPLAMNLCELVESDNDLALVEYATKYDTDFALTCADAATKSATASITKVACPATLGVVAVTPANGHDHYYSGGVYYPAKPDLTSADACAVPGLPTTTAAPALFAESNTVVPASVSITCHNYGNIHLVQYTPKVAGAGMLKFYLKGASVYDAAVTVAPGAISAMSTVEGSGLAMAEAGVTATFDVVAKDVESNRIYTGGERSKVAVAVSGGTTASVSITDLGTGKYQVMIVYPHAGTFTVNATVGGSSIYAGECVVSEFQARDVVTYSTKPSVRFEHSMVEYQGDLYAFGGAAKDKTYLSETWKYDMTSTSTAYAYRQMVAVKGVTAAYNVEVVVDTASLIAAGKMRSDCLDSLFLTAASSTPLGYWIEPAGTPSGCGSANTRYWVSVSDSLGFAFYYGNPKPVEPGPSPSIFEFFEDFETTPTANGWSLDPTAGQTCTPNYNFVGEASSFTSSSDTVVHGSAALRVDAETFAGGALMKSVTPMTKFVMKAFMYDTECSGAHFISPDYDPCSAGANAKSYLPAMKTGAGVYTDATSKSYTVTYPWQATSASRSKGWHSITFKDDDKTLKTVFDDAVTARETTVDTTLDKVFIFGRAFEGQTGSSAYYDAVLATAYDSAVSATVSGTEEFVDYTAGEGWSQVGNTNSPPARQAHTASVYGDSMYVFGGERASYEYADLWRYQFATDTWTFQSVKNSTSELARHDHSAVVYKDGLYVYGGRNPTPLSDFYVYSFAEGTWRKLSTEPEMTARFGHAAAVVGDTMLVSGGYSHTSGKLVEELWEYSFTSATWTLLGPREGSFQKTDPKVAITFPMAIPSARFSHSAVVYGKNYYILGGAGGESMYDDVADVWVYDPAKKSWSLPSGNYNSVTAVARYDAATAAVGAYAVSFGGHSSTTGGFFNDMKIVFVGESGV